MTKAHSEFRTVFLKFNSLPLDYLIIFSLSLRYLLTTSHNTLIMRNFITLLVLIIPVFGISQTVIAPTSITATITPDNLLMVVADTILYQYDTRVEVFTPNGHKIIGYMDIDTMYFPIPYNTDFSVKCRMFKTFTLPSGRVRKHSVWTNEVQIYQSQTPPPPPPAPPIVISYENDVVTSGTGWVYVIEQWGQIIFQEQVSEGDETFIDPNLFEQGKVYHIVFWDSGTGLTTVWNKYN
jgi:hypothetical protein